MNQPWVYTCPPILNPAPPLPSLPYPSGLSQSTGFGRPASCIKLALVIYFTHGNTHVSVLFSQIIPPLPSPTESKSLFFTSISLLLPYMWSEVKSLSRVRLFVTPWTGAYQAPLSMGFSRQEYWSGLPFPSPGDLPNSGIEPRSPTLQADALTSESPEKPCRIIITIFLNSIYMR